MTVAGALWPGGARRPAYFGRFGDSINRNRVIDNKARLYHHARRSASNGHPSGPSLRVGRMNGAHSGTSRLRSGGWLFDWTPNLGSVRSCK